MAPSLKYFLQRKRLQGDPLLYSLVEPLTCSMSLGRRLLEYSIGGGVATVVLAVKDGAPYYCVEEHYPGEATCRKAVLDAGIELASRALADGRSPAELQSAAFVLAECGGADMSDIVLYTAEKIAKGYGPLYPLTIDPEVEEIALDGPDYVAKIVHRRIGPIWASTNVVLGAESADAIIQFLAKRGGRELSLARPYTEALLPEGHRLAATLHREVTRHGSSLVIRKHRGRPIRLVSLVKNGVLSPLLAAYLWTLVEYRKPILIAGPTASGKTTLLQALLDLVPPWSRIVTVEDTPELNLSSHPNWDSLVTRPVYGLEEGEDITLYKLVRFALRRRPDYLVVGEIRGEEARVFAYAASSGHAALTTMHAETAEIAVRRLRHPPFSVDDQLIASIKSIVVVKRFGLLGGARRVTEAAEPLYDDASGKVRVSRIFAWLPGNGIFLPDSVDMVVEQSSVLEEIMLEEGLSRSQLSKELMHKARIVASESEASFPYAAARYYAAKYLDSLGGGA